MKKLYKLKSWFSLGDAAERLSAGLREPVSVEDILQLAIEDRLPLSWYTRHVPARKIALYTALFGRGYGTEFDQLFPNHEETSSDILSAVESWNCLDGEKAIVYLDGPFRLELQHCGALKDWIHAHLTHTGSELTSLDGFFVSDADETLWQILEYNSGHRYTTDDGKEEKLAPFYYPSARFPDEAELVIQRKDIEAFENSLIEPSGIDSPNLSKRNETSYLHMLGALLEVISQGIPSPEPTVERIGPAAGFVSEAKLIAAVVDYYDGFDGVSKRNLEKVFANAKRRVKDSH